MNFYAVLGVPPNADEEAIRNAYRVLARRYHPDRGAGSSAEKFRAVKDAYETLIDTGSRRAYDHSLYGAASSVPVKVESMVSPVGVFRGRSLDLERFLEEWFEWAGRRGW